MTDIPQTLEEEQFESDPQRSPGAQAPGDELSPGRVGNAHDGAPPLSAVPNDANADEAAEVADDLGELVSTAAQRDQYLALAQRTQADFENFRKRVAREAAVAQERGVSSLAKELLPALDNLDRALAEAGTAAEGGGQADPLLEGVRLVRSELTAALARAGIESFSPAGEPFDPEVHEAVATAAQPPGGQPSGTVVEVYQPGYRLGASILRPARVVVAA